MTVASRATRFAGIPFRHLDMDAAVALLLSDEGLRSAVPWRLVNAYSVTLGSQDEAYGAVLRGGGVNLADGSPVAWILRRLSRRTGSSTSPHRVRGPSFFSRVLDEGRTRGVRHFLLGGSPETLAALRAAIAERFPGASVVGAESPPFRPLTPQEQADQDRRIRESGADLVWVGLGTPRQDVEAARLARSVARPAVAVGAAFDFLAGTKAEAPAWVQRLSMEWLFRFVSEPRRLWRRYTVELGRLAGLVIRELRAQPRRDRTPLQALPAVRTRSAGDLGREARQASV